MIRHIHFSQTLDKEIKRLQKAGTQGEQAVAKFQNLLADIKTYSCQFEAVASKRTKKGEQRIKNCVKYDLGGGYRLVTVRVNDHLFVPFLGSHDETDQWFQRHRYDNFQPDVSLYREEKVTPLKAGCIESFNEPDVEERADDEYEEQLRGKIDEPLLKSVFQGLFRNNYPPTNSIRSTAPHEKK